MFSLKRRRVISKCSSLRRGRTLVRNIYSRFPDLPSANHHGQRHGCRGETQAYFCMYPALLILSSCPDRQIHRVWDGYHTFEFFHDVSQKFRPKHIWWDVETVIIGAVVHSTGLHYLDNIHTYKPSKQRISNRRSSATRSM